jgi:oxygen-independent coproporphyrinogen-3 oxidase
MTDLNFNHVILMPLKNPPLSLYIHMPWCIRKCPYCDFNSHQKPAQMPEEQYIERLCEQAKLASSLAKDREIISIFIGGGTPNLISPKSYHQLFNRLKNEYQLSSTVEITMEANPGAHEHHDWGAFLQTGINRLSLGAQSFSDTQLQALGRIHSAENIKQAYATARQSGFVNINIDLMHALIHQSVPEALDDLQQAIQLNPEHISWYQLTLEPNTVFAKNPPKTSSIDDIVDMEEKGVPLLNQQGYAQYEVSAFCKKDKQCRHNVNYWQFGDYLGLGAGAHGKITQIDDNKIFRTTHFNRPETFIESQKTFATFEMIKENELAFEFMLNALRLEHSVSFDLFEERTGLALATIEPTLNKLHHQDLLTIHKHSFALTLLGKRYRNDVISAFL